MMYIFATVIEHIRQCVNGRAYTSGQTTAEANRILFRRHLTNAVRDVTKTNIATGCIRSPISRF